MNHSFILAFLILFATSCGGSQEPSWPPEDHPELQHYIRLSDNIHSGGEPKGEIAFQFLRNRGIKSILNVDGARPRVAMARKYGMTYAHVPIGYDRLEAAEIARICRALNDAPKPVYVHCHHGKHRGPTAAMIGRILLDNLKPDDAILEMTQIGTSPNYTGLYFSIQNLILPAQSILDGLAPIPAIAEVSDLAEAMAALDRHWDNIKSARKNKWQDDPNNPDITAVHESLLVAEALTEIHRFSDKREADFLKWLTSCRNSAWETHRALKRADHKAATASQQSTKISCKRCHNKYRD